MFNFTVVMMHQTQILSPAFNRDYVEAGVDEAGRGCLAGPVVAAAVILPQDYFHPVLNDSKQLDKQQRARLKDEIMQNALTYGIAEASNQEIDHVNILNAAIMAMHRALDQLDPRPEMILVDGNRFKPYRFIPYQCIIKGDSHYFSIAAASVLAKCHRDEIMHQLADDFPVYDWHKNVGYPTAAHRNAIMQHGVTPYHRKSFKLLSSA